VTKARMKALERIHILRTIINGGGESGMHAAVIADRANAECDHDLLEMLPEISRRGIGQKLSAMSLDGLLQARLDRDRIYLWTVTAKGQEMAGSLPYAPTSWEEQ
jgi:hypothetical protein